MFYMFHFSYVYKTTYFKNMSGKSYLQEKHMVSPNIAQTFATLFSYFRSIMITDPLY